MTTDGTFQKVYRAVCQQSYIRDLKSDWARLDNNYSRVEYLISEPKLEGLLSVRSSSTPKHLAAAKTLKGEGNNYFQKKNHAAALSAYNKAIMLTPFKDHDGLLSVCYANRSAVLFHMKKYANCLNDIVRAVEAGYPKELHYKLLIRKAKCHQFIEVDQRESVIAEALASLTFSNLDEAGEHLWRKDLAKVTETLKVDNEISQNTLSSAPSTQLDRCNSQYPALSHSVNVLENSEFGRYIQAKEHLSTGEVVLAEKPYCSVTLPDYYMTHCCHCQVNVDLTPVPCAQCADVIYCSSECQKVSWSAYHHFECAYSRNLKDVNINMGHLALRIALQAGFAKLLQIIKGKATPNESSYTSEDYFNVFQLEGHELDRSVDDLFWRAVASVLLANTCDITEWEKSDKTARTILAAFTLHHMQVLPCNAHEISEMLYDKQVPYQSELLEIGAGIYSSLSFFNHSCDPTVVRSFTNGNTCLVKTLCPIGSNEQLFDNYGCLYAVHPVSERRAKLPSQYYFECCCEPCLQDWGLYSSMSYEAEPMYKCSMCSSLIMGDSCSKCDERFDNEATNKALTRAKSSFDQVLASLFSQHIDGQQRDNLLRKMVVYSNLVNGLVFRPYRTLNDCQEALKHVYNMYGNITVKYD